MAGRVSLILKIIFSIFALCATNAAVAQTPAVSEGYQYKLGSGDKVRIIVFGEDNLGGEFVVSGEGTVSLPLIGDQAVQGLTAVQVQNKIQTALSDGYMKEPRVNVEVLTFRPFYILGEVSNPGEYPYSNGLTVMNAVARASGFTYRADKRKVYIKHANTSEEVEVPLTTGTVVAPGDTIRIGERYF